jgi:hypothetical protein
MHDTIVEIQASYRQSVCLLLAKRIYRHRKNHRSEEYIRAELRQFAPVCERHFLMVTQIDALIDQMMIMSDDQINLMNF